MTVYWCGFNGFKQIASDSNSIALGFIPISVEDIKDISFAWDCAIILSGVCFSIPSPITLPGIRVTDIACGFEHCLILDEFGRVFSWGSGMRGQLGYNVLETSDCPVEVDTLSGLQVTSIAAGGWHSAAVTYSGIVYTWGWNNSGQLGFPTLESSDSVSTLSVCEEEGNIENVAMKVDTVHLQRDDTDLKTFSKVRSFKRFKLDETRKIKIEKKQITDESVETNFDLRFSGTEEIRDDCIDEKSQKSYKVPLCDLDISNLERSSAQRCFVTVLAVPKAVSFPCEEDVSVTDVSCGNRHTVFLTGDGSVWGCGWNAYSQLGESPNILTSSDSVIKLNIKSDKQKICKILCGGWNTAVFFEE